MMSLSTSKLRQQQHGNNPRQTVWLMMLNLGSVSYT